MQQTAVAEARLDDLRDSMRLILGDTVESLSGIAGAEHAVDRIFRRGIAIAERQADPDLQMRLGQALVRKGEHGIQNSGPSPAAAQEMERGFGLVKTGLTALGRTGNPTSAGFAMDVATVHTRLGDPVSASEAADQAAAQLKAFVPANESHRIDTLVVQARLTLTRARILQLKGQFGEFDRITSDALAALREIDLPPVPSEGSATDLPRPLNQRPEYQRGRIRAMEANLLGLRVYARQFHTGATGTTRETAESIAAQIFEAGRDLSNQHGANRLLDARTLGMRLNSATLLAQLGEFEDARAVFEQCVPSLPDWRDPNARVQELIASIAGIRARAALAEALGETAELEAIARDAAALGNVFEARLSPSFFRTHVIADLILIAGNIQRDHGDPSNASTQLTRAYTLYEGLAESSPEHFYIAVSRCKAALALHQVLESDPTTDPEWLMRAQAHFDALPGDKVAHDSLAELADRLYAALEKR